MTHKQPPRRAADAPGPLSRRAVLKSIGLVGLSGLARPDVLTRMQQEGTPAPQVPLHWRGEPLARITNIWQNVRAEPTIDSPLVAELFQDDVVRVRRAVRGQTVFLYNDLWLETRLGYIYSSFVQPLWYHLPNIPATPEQIGGGRWATLTVPFSDAYWQTRETGRDSEWFAGRMYYNTVHRVTGVSVAEDGTTWYRVEELYGEYFMRATHLRLIPPEELAPISPEVPAGDKHIEINLTEQMMTAFEDGTPVMRHRVATGREDKETPEGIHYVVDKRVSDRMTNGTAATEAEEEIYNLAGVPFVSYFTWDWVAFHGTYWHNDYGQPRSAGCVNLPPEVARWVWRWTTPYPPLDEFYYRPNNATEGTLVVVYS